MLKYRTIKEWQLMTSSADVPSRFLGAYQIGFGKNISDFENSEVVKLHQHFRITQQLLLQWSQYAGEQNEQFCYESLVPKAVLEALESDNDRLQTKYRLNEGPLQEYVVPFSPMAAYCCAMHEGICNISNTDGSSVRSHQIRLALEDVLWHGKLDEQAMTNLMAYFAPMRQVVRELIENAINNGVTCADIVNLHKKLIDSKCYTE